jgi:mannose-1-phosphate guanylyltransferase
LKALLLAGGYGTRLHPLTNYLPKCMVPILGRPLLDYWLEALVSGGVNEILINTHYLPSLVSSYIKKSTWSPFVSIVNEVELLGTGGTILKNKDFFEDEPFMVAHADNLTLFDIPAFFSAHQNRPEQAEITMMVFEADDPSSCGIVELDDYGLVIKFHEKVERPPGIVANAAVYIIEHSVIKYLENIGTDCIDFSTQVIPAYMGKIFTFQNTLFHRDIGNPASFCVAHTDFPVLEFSKINKKSWNSVLQEIDCEPINKFMDEHKLHKLTAKRLLKKKFKQYTPAFILNLVTIYSRKKSVAIESREVFNAILNLKIYRKKNIVVVYDTLNSPPTFGDYFSVLFIAYFFISLGKNVTFLLVNGDYSGSYKASWNSMGKDKQEDIIKTYLEAARVLLDSDKARIELLSSDIFLEKLASEIKLDSYIFCKKKVSDRQRIYPYCFNFANKISMFLSKKVVLNCLISICDFKNKVQYRSPEQPYITFHCRYSQHWGFDRNISADEFVKTYFTLKKKYPDIAVMVVSDDHGCEFFRNISLRNDLECLFSKDYSDTILGDGALILASDFYYALRGGGGISVFPILSGMPYKIVAPNFGHWIPWSKHKLSYWSTENQSWAKPI